MKARLATPGPTEVPDSVRLAGARPIVHHRSPSMEELLADVTARLRHVFLTQDDVFISLSSGTGGMEAAVANLFGEGDKVLVVSNGYFGERFESIAAAYGITPVVVRSTWGTSVDVSAVAQAFADNPDLAGALVVHSETSTGALNDVQSIGRLFADTDVIVVVDAISSLVTHEVQTAGWGLDVVIAASHKAFMMPPGLTFLAVSPKAMARSTSRPRPAYYWSFKRLAHFHPMPPSSPGVSLLYALDEALNIMTKDELSTLQRKASTLASATLAGLTAMGFRPFVTAPHTRNNVVTAVVAPEGLDTERLRERLESKWGITVTGGQGPYKGKLLRVGHVGATDILDLAAILAACELVVRDENSASDLGAGTTAFLQSLADERVAL